MSSIKTIGSGIVRRHWVLSFLPQSMHIQTMNIESNLAAIDILGSTSNEQHQGVWLWHFAAETRSEIN